MHKRLLTTLVFILLIAPSLLLAQERLTETYVSPDERLTLRYPEGWVVNTEEEGITLLATSEGVIDTISDTIASGEAALALVFSDSDPSPEPGLFDGGTPNAIVRRAIELISEDSNNVGRFTEPQRTTLHGRPGARSSGTISGNDVLLIGLGMGENVFMLAFGVTASGELERFEPKMVAILESINYLPAALEFDLNTLQTITPDNADQLEPLWTTTPHIGIVYAVAISPDGQLIASSGADGEIYLLSTVNGDAVRTLSGHTAGVEQVLFSPDGETLASLSSDGSFRLWDVATGEQRLVFGHDEALFYMAYSPGGRWIAYSSYVQNRETFETESSTVWLADAQDERERSITTLESDLFVNSVAFSPNGDVLMFSASNDQDPEARQISVWLWDIERNQAIDSWVREGNPVDVFFTPTGRPYATMNDIAEPNDLLVWDVEENYVQHRLTGFDDLAYHVVLNTEGTILGAASYDGTVRLWDMASGGELAALEHDSDAYGVAFSNDSRMVATSDGIGNVMLWGIQ